ncbi:carboxyl transferase domain-containing protein [Alteromonas sp. M12]|uniref:acyl-CoA carboxylase subunit beta n=1 Tax=Alteromonas sp. M12 TaxID=3135644 RepID=UPI00319DE402
MDKQQSLRKAVINSHSNIQDEARKRAVEYQHSRGKLTARERVELICDKDTFLEFGGLALPSDNNDSAPSFGDALVTGWADIEHKRVIIAVADFTINGGSNGDIGLEKMRRSYMRAIDSGVPMVQLLEGVGHRISEGLDSRLFSPGFDSLALQAQLSGWVPTPVAVLGQSFAAMTLIASMCDFVVVVKGMSYMGIAPPQLVKKAIGENIDAEELGGSDTQAKKNGIADYIVNSEDEASSIIKQYLSYFPANSSLAPPVSEVKAPDPIFAAKLPEIIPADMRYAYDVKKVIKGIIDADSMLEIKADYAKNIVCCLVKIGGRSVGIVANQPNFLAGSLDSPACEKAAHFINLCDSFGIALLFLLDLPGFLVGSEVERSKLARKSARLIYEIALTTVPTYNVVLRKAYGGAYMAMNGGRSFNAELTLAWPTAEFAAMNVETAVDVAFKKQIMSAEDPQQEKQKIVEQTREKLGPIRAAEGFGIDDVILPEQTRKYLVHALKSAPVRRRQTTNTPKTRPVSPI